jgi:hypothetical protein
MVHDLNDSFFANRTNLQIILYIIMMSAKIVKYCGVENRLRSDAGQMRSPSVNVVQCMLPPNYVRLSQMNWWWDSVHDASVCRIMFVLREKVGCEG